MKLGDKTVKTPQRNATTRWNVLQYPTIKIIVATANSSGNSIFSSHKYGVIEEFFKLADKISEIVVNTVFNDSWNY